MRRLVLIASLSPLLAAPAWAAQDTHDMAGQGLFERADADHDGRLSKAEHAAAAQLMFDQLDADHDGEASAAEMEAHHDAMHARHMERERHAEAGKDLGGERKPVDAGDMLGRWDGNGDGQLSASEHAAAAAAMFDRMDDDHDGFLGRAEFDLGHAPMHEGMHGPDGHAMRGHDSGHDTMQDARPPADDDTGDDR
jgi:hypothetical protein